LPAAKARSTSVSPRAFLVSRSCPKFCLHSYSETIRLRMLPGFPPTPRLRSKRTDARARPRAPNFGRHHASAAGPFRQAHRLVPDHPGWAPPRESQPAHRRRRRLPSARLWLSALWLRAWFSRLARCSAGTRSIQPASRGAGCTIPGSPPRGGCRRRHYAELRRLRLRQTFCRDGPGRMPRHAPRALRASPR
jgi:hypothetical protein